MDADTGKRLHRVALDSGWQTYRLDVSPYWGRRVYLQARLKISDPQKGQVQFGLVRRYCSDKSVLLAQSALTAKETLAAITDQFALYPAYPNPFNPVTTIAFSVPVRSRVTLQVFDVLGREVARLVDGEKAAGGYELRFNAANLPSGVYIYRLHAVALDGERREFEAKRKMLLVK